MDFEPALEAELSSIAELGGRIYPLREATKKNGEPYLIYASSEGLPDKSLGGFLKSKEVRGELNVVAARYSEMKAITKKVVALLIGMEGRQIGTNGPFIEEMTYQMPIELYEDQPALHRCLIEFQIYFGEE